MRDICAKYEVDPTIGLGGVRGHTHTQTDTQRTYGYYSIDDLFQKNNLKSLFLYNEKLNNTIHTSKAQCLVDVIFQMQSLVQYD